MKIINQSRDYRDKKLKMLASFLLKIKLTPNILTTFSLIFALLATYFLFNNHYLYVFFVALHLLSDGLDGVMARLIGPTKFGKYYDHLVDRSMTLMILIKAGLIINHHYCILIIILFILTQTIYVVSKFKFPVLMMRIALVTIMVFNFVPFNQMFDLNVGVYLVAFTLSINSLVRQFLYCRKRMKID